jgi:hypothetical protein
MREARGEYIVLFNADNILYPNALETIAAEIRRAPRVFDRLGNAGDSNNIIIFPIIMNDYQRMGTHQVRLPAGSGAGMIFTGNPPTMGLIDCMQLVMKRELWLAVGGWYDKRPASDGFIYPELAARFGYRAVCPVLGEHF